MNPQYISTNRWVPRITREEARRFPCPKCGAIAGQLCKNDGGFRGTNHAERAGAIRQAHLAKAKAAIDAIPAEAWNYAKAYLENLGRSSVVTGLTPCEEEIGNRAFTFTGSSTHLLVQHHAEQRSFSDIAEDWGKSLETVERFYQEALTQFASRLAPLVSGSCASCQRHMPEIVSNHCLRCPKCRQALENLWRQRSSVAQTKVDPVRLMESYRLLGVHPGISTDEIRRARDEQLDQLKWALSDQAPDYLKVPALTHWKTVIDAAETIRRDRAVHSCATN